MERPSLDAAHALRTPLTRIRGELDLILRSGVGDPPRSQLERILEDLEELSRLCGGLLLLARLDRAAGGPGPLDEEVALDAVVSELLEQVTPLAQDRGVSLRRVATRAARVRGSRPLLVEALLNLLDRAIRGAREGGLVSVSIGSDGRLVQVVVADGIREDDENDIGLALARGIARVHGGRFELDSAASGQSTFRLVLPASEAT